MERCSVGLLVIKALGESSSEVVTSGDLDLHSAVEDNL